MKRSNNILRFLYIIFGVVFLAVVINVFLVSVLKYHIRSNTNYGDYIENASVVKETVHAKRGSIFAGTGEIIAQDKDTYDVICYLSDQRMGYGNVPAYVDDPATTASVLATVLEGDQTEIFKLLSQKNLYQTEIGLCGKNISEEKKKEIESYGLHGIGFRQSYKRQYNFGDVLSPYLIGFAQSNEDGKIIGKMGLEQSFDLELSGIDGEHEYQQDKNGYILPGMYDSVTPSRSGYDIYTTIDVSIQNALQTSFDDLAEGADEAWGAIVEIDTGKIKAWGQKPSFDPNILNIENYNNYGTQLPYEPGSVFKSFIYAAAIDTNKYNGTAAFDSSPFCYFSNGNTPYRSYGKNYGCIYNANGKNWGNIELDYGLIYSSNVATSTLLTDYVGTETYIDYVKKFGFFNYVDTDDIREEIGLLNYTYPSEKLALTYGQGSSVTMLQLLQGYTAIFGNGEMIKPYFIDKIVDPETNQVMYQGTRQVVNRVIKEESARKLQELLKRVVYDDRGTAKIYKVDEVEIIAKTGTAERIVNAKYTRDTYINSVMLAFPADHPKYMIYFAYVYPYDYGNKDNSGAVKNLIRKVALLTNVDYNSDKNQETIKSKYAMPNVLNKNLEDALFDLKTVNANVYVIGDGDTVLSQYPNINDTIYSNTKVFLKTSDSGITVPNFENWTRSELINYWNISGLGITINGAGVCYNQSIMPDVEVSKDDEIIVDLKRIDSYIQFEKEEETIEE